MREEVIRGAVEMCGLLDVAALATDAKIERGRANILQALPDGIENARCVMGVSHHLPSHTQLLG